MFQGSKYTTLLVVLFCTIYGFSQSDSIIKKGVSVVTKKDTSVLFQNKKLIIIILIIMEE